MIRGITDGNLPIYFTFVIFSCWWSSLQQPQTSNVPPPMEVPRGQLDWQVLLWWSTLDHIEFFFSYLFIYLFFTSILYFFIPTFLQMPSRSVFSLCLDFCTTTLIATIVCHGGSGVQGCQVWLSHHFSSPWNTPALPALHTTWFFFLWLTQFGSCPGMFEDYVTLWNVWQCFFNVKWLKADIVCLQETYSWYTPLSITEVL